MFKFCQAINKHRLVYIFINCIFTRLKAFQVFHILWSKCQQGHSGKYRNSPRHFPVSEMHQFRGKERDERRHHTGAVTSTGGEYLKEIHGSVISLTGKTLMDTSQLLAVEECDLDKFVE